MLHITDGESVAGTLREAVVPGDVAVYGYLLYDGPAARLEAYDGALASSSAHEETVLWFDHSLSNQLMLIKALDWLGAQGQASRKLSLIPSSGAKAFGSLPAARLTELFGTRIPATKAHFHVAHAAWTAFTAADPTALHHFLTTDPALPFLAAALRRHLEEFPAVASGLSRTERQALTALREQGPLSALRLFFTSQQREEVPYMGDRSFFNIVTGLATARQPLIRAEDDRVKLLPAGLDVLEGRTDHAAMNGIDRWLGGVHLTGNRPSWRWDAEAGRVVTGLKAPG